MYYLKKIVLSDKFTMNIYRQTDIVWNNRAQLQSLETHQANSKNGRSECPDQVICEGNPAAIIRTRK